MLRHGEEPARQDLLSKFDEAKDAEPGSSRDGPPAVAHKESDGIGSGAGASDNEKNLDGPPEDDDEIPEAGLFSRRQQRALRKAKAKRKTEHTSDADASQAEDADEEEDIEVLKRPAARKGRKRAAKDHEDAGTRGRKGRGKRSQAAAQEVTEPEPADEEGDMFQQEAAPFKKPAMAKESEGKSSRRSKQQDVPLPVLHQELPTQKRSKSAKDTGVEEWTKSRPLWRISGRSCRSFLRWWIWRRSSPRLPAMCRSCPTSRKRPRRRSRTTTRKATVRLWTATRKHEGLAIPNNNFSLPISAHARLFAVQPPFVMDAYWSRAQCGLKYGQCHVALASFGNMEINIEYTNRVAACLS